VLVGGEYWRPGEERAESVWLSEHVGVAHEIAGGAVGSASANGKLRKRQEFSRVFQAGARVRRGDVSALWIWRAGRTRLGLAVRRGEGRAADRVRMRRQLREAFRTALRYGRLPAEGLDVVLLGVAGRGSGRSSRRWHRAMEVLEEVGKAAAGE
jgi:ribonuclease P protein component